MASSAVSNADISRVVGYAIQPGNFGPQTNNLPIAIAVIGEMNTANQATAVTPVQITSQAQAAALYGWGSPLALSMGHYFPANGGGGANGIPVWAFPVLSPEGATANTQTITPTGTPTANVTHTVMIAGRGALPTGSYDINIATTDTPSTIITKMVDAITNVLGCPLYAINQNGIASSVIHSGAAGTGYVANDTGTISNIATGAILATYKVLTVSGGAVSTYQITSVGTLYTVTTGVDTATGGAQPGSGTGFKIDISTLTAAVQTTAKWAGLTSEGINISVNTYGNPAGISYAITELGAGAGTPDIDATLATFGNVWYPLVDNTFGLVASIISSLDAFNGNPNNQQGRYAPTTFKPFIAITGNVIDSTTTSADTAITNGDSLNNTIMVATAPLSQGLPLDASADYTIRFANCCQNTPNIDIQGSYSIDIPMPVAGSNPATTDYAVRNAVVQLGMSTALITNGAYECEDLVTTYHPAGETPPQFRYGRDVMIDLNIKYQFYLFLSQTVANKQIANDNDSVSASNVCKPKDVKSGLARLITSLVGQGLCVNAAYSIANTVVNISSSNPNRFEITWPYMRSGVVRIISTTVTAGFNFGNIS